MKKEEFYEKFLKVIRPEHNVFRKVTKELMMENGLFLEFEKFVERGILTPIKETDKYFINWDLLKSYIEKQSFDENGAKLFSEMAKEIADLKKQIRKQAKEIADLKKQIRRLQNELNAKETKDEVEELLEQI